MIEGFFVAYQCLVARFGFECLFGAVCLCLLIQALECCGCVVGPVVADAGFDQFD